MNKTYTMQEIKQAINTLRLEVRHTDRPAMLDAIEVLASTIGNDAGSGKISLQWAQEIIMLKLDNARLLASVTTPDLSISPEVRWEEMRIICCPIAMWWESKEGLIGIAQKRMIVLHGEEGKDGYISHRPFRIRIWQRIMKLLNDIAE